MDNTPQEHISRLFSYKAEWLKEAIFDLYSEPSYLPQLKTARPCVLIGGRGTGKTTVLKCMSYDGQFALSGGRASSIPEWQYYGLYYKVNTNRVAAFRGSKISQEKWISLFSHYFNLVMCRKALCFLKWYQDYFPNLPTLPLVDCRKVATSLFLQPCDDLNDLIREAEDKQLNFEAYINNVAGGGDFSCSLQGVPLDTLFEAILKLPHFSGKHFFFLIDEYENFEEYQQQVVNTILKHSGEFYTFKIGVRELGWRCRSTLNINERLTSPSDYVLLDLKDRFDEDQFKQFAIKVCNDRLARLPGGSWEIQRLLNGLSYEDEAQLLDGERGLVSEAKAELLAAATESQREALIALKPLELYLVYSWAKSHSSPLQNEIESRIRNPEEWANRYQNYAYSLLFTINAGKPGLRKYYCGYDVFVQLAANNIRYFLELVEQVLTLHLQNKGTLSESVPPETQTLAAQKVGRKNLGELEGLSVDGAQLVKLLLGFGRIFQIMAADAGGHTPEVNQFHITDNDFPDQRNLRLEEETTLHSLLTSAVMHLALLRLSGSKLGDETDTRDYDYMIHPIFSPFFEYSYRKKRKLLISGRDVFEIVSKQKTAIRRILSSSNRHEEALLPEQLSLFEAYYNEDP